MKRILLVYALLLAALPAWSRTVILDGAAIDRAAVIQEDAPLQGWAGQSLSPGVFDSGNVVVNAKSALLLRFDLSSIPKGQRIAHAELTAPVSWGAGADLRFFLWRLTAEWGPGVCWKYRAVGPAKLEWAKAGARGAGTDRSVRPSAIVPVPKPADCRINVTEDVDLWYTGGAPACGWLFTMEEPEAAVMTGSPLWAGLPQWKLKITYEPE